MPRRGVEGLESGIQEVVSVRFVFSSREFAYRRVFL